MDPGNWATALAGGAKYGYQLLSVVVTASLMGLLLQALASQVGIVTGRDLAELCRERYGKATIIFLWIASEVSIVACDVAEVLGSAVAMQLLFGFSLTICVVLSAFGTCIMLALQSLGRRPLQVTVSLLILFVGFCFVIELTLIKPPWAMVFHGLRPSISLLRDVGMVWLAAGIVGSTVMPHNLYLHSTLVKGFAPRNECISVAQAIKIVNIDTAVSLAFAFAVNASLLIVAAAIFNASGHTDVSDLGDAHRLIAPLVGSKWASVLFASALLACGLNATVTGTLAGQAVMEGFLKMRLARWARALLTRTLAIGPALLAVGAFGGRGSNWLLLSSQVVLSMQLPLVVIPLVRCAADPFLMGSFRIRGVFLGFSWACAGIIALLNFVMILQLLPGF